MRCLHAKLCLRLVFCIPTLISCGADETNTSNESLSGTDLAGSEESTPAGIEAGISAGTEAGMSAGTEAGMSVGTEAGMSAGTEAGISAGTEAGMPAGTEAGNDGGTEETVRVQGECTNAADMERLMSLGNLRVNMIVQSCSYTSCEDVANHPSHCSQCIESATELSQGCIGCYLELINCNLQSCMEACANPADPSLCESCRDQICRPLFVRCAGNVE